MPIFHAIAAMSENRVIGNHGRIPWHIPEDFRWFKHKTMGGTLIMGRKTFESIGKPLPGRKTVVLSRDSGSIPGVSLCPSLKCVHDLMADSPPFWICGGAEIYAQLLPECALLYLTRVKKVADGDAYFPAFENDFNLEQVIHETTDYRVERWCKKDTFHDQELDRWPF